MDVEQVFKEFQDHLAPRLDTYEQAIYLYLFRHTRVVGLDDAVIAFKSARARMACGVGQSGRPMAEATVYEKLLSLQDKGCIVILDSNRDGRRLRVNLPAEISGVVVSAGAMEEVDIEAEDFFSVEENRRRVLLREEHQCFYCMRTLNGDNYVIEHVVSRPVGSNNYRNIVAACRHCNNRKGSSTAEDWLRTLYREGFIDASTFQARLSHLERLRAGDLKPPARVI